MPKKEKLTRVAWSKDDVKTLKTSAKQKKWRDKIAKSLKRTPGAVMVKASALGVSLSTRWLATLPYETHHGLIRKKRCA
jgi:hypothetical protein